MALDSGDSLENFDEILSGVSDDLGGISILSDVGDKFLAESGCLVDGGQAFWKGHGELVIDVSADCGGVD